MPSSSSSSLLSSPEFFLRKRWCSLIFGLFVVLLMLSSTGIAGPFLYSSSSSSSASTVLSSKASSSSSTFSSAGSTTTSATKKRTTKKKTETELAQLYAEAGKTDIPDGYYLPIAGVYVFYRRPRAFMHAIEAYRRNYPQENLFMFCDNGCYNYTGAAKYARARFDGQPRNIVAKNSHGAFYIGPTQAKIFLGTYREVVNTIDEPFFIQLEDDVFTIKQVKSKLLHDINGWAPDKRVVGEAETYIRSKNPYAPKELILGGFGGCVFRTSFWRQILNRPDIDTEVDELYHHGKVHAYGIDYIMASLTYRFNGTLGTFDGYIEAFEPEADRLRKENKVEILHGFKDMYKFGLTWQDREILGSFYENALTIPGV